MAFISSESTKFIQAIYKTYSDRNTLLNELVYGKQMIYYDLSLESPASIWLYLHQNNPEILICLSDRNRRFIFDIRRIHLFRSNYKYQMDYHLKQSQYLIVEDFDEEIIFIFHSVQERENFYRLIRGVSIYLSQLPSELDSVVLKNFIRADINQNLLVSMDELKNLMFEIKLNLGEQLRDIFMYVQEGKISEALNYRQFEQFAKIIDCHKELLNLFENFCSAKINSYQMLLQKVMKVTEFKEFLKEEQQESTSNIDKICKTMFPTENTRLSFFQFCRFLNSPLNSAMNPQYENFQTDMTHPLLDYYCYSSHNTYLTGNQLTSDSRAERYLQDLLEGIRCVEIDVHDGYGGPIVKHGYTATASITFEKTIQQISKFHKENQHHTPIIISLENHCGSEYQYEMVKIMEKNFESSLIHINQFEPDHKLTLQQAIGKIIIKCSGSLKLFNSVLGNHENVIDEKIQQHSNKQEDNENQEEEDPNDLLPNQEDIKYLQIKTAAFKKRREAFENKIQIIFQRKEMFLQKKKAIQRFVKSSFKTKTHEKSGKLINFKLLGITSMLGNGKMGAPSQWESISINENKLINYFTNHKEEQLRNQTKQGWIRVYPKGSRFDSSNYNPLPALEVGAQIIALNSQNSDHYTHLMKKFFMKGINKVTGYRLRPNIQKFQQLKIIKVTPISASKIYFDNQQRKNQIPICQIRMRYYGLYKDFPYNTEEIKWASYTQPIADNAYHPLFERNGTLTVRYHCEEVGFIAMEISGCGIGIVPIDSIRKGYRSVFLYDDQLKQKASKVLCLIQ